MSDTDTTAEGYVDVCLLPVREAKLDAYRQQATTFGSVAQEHGALRYREFRADDVDEKWAVEAGQLLTVAVAEFRSRAHRDEVMKDPRVVELVEGEELADMSQLRYGGFATFVSP